MKDISYSRALARAQKNFLGGAAIPKDKPSTPKKKTDPEFTVTAKNVTKKKVIKKKPVKNSKPKVA